MKAHGNIPPHRRGKHPRFRRRDRLAVRAVALGSLLLMILLGVLSVQQPLPTSGNPLDANEGLAELERLVDRALIPGDRSRRPFAEAAVESRASGDDVLLFDADMATDHETFVTNLSLAHRLELAALNPLRTVSRTLPDFGPAAAETPYLGPENHDITDLFDAGMDKAEVREITAYSVGMWSLDFERHAVRPVREGRANLVLPR